jgi:hypothetical protein
MGSKDKTSLRRGTATALGFLPRLFLTVWGALILYFAGSRWPWLGWGLAAVFLVVGFILPWKLWQWQGWLAFGLLFLALQLWWGSVRPRNDRDWKPEVARVPRAEVEGDRVRLLGVRNFTYRSKTDFDIRYEDREVLLSKLESVDFLISRWSDGPIAHTFVSFNFADAPPVCVSIEARLPRGKAYHPLAGCFKQAELIYVVGDERDLVRVRTDFRGEKVSLFRIRNTPEGTRRLFLSYVEHINSLAETPEFYHSLSNNCTVSIYRLAQRSGARGKFDPRLLLNGDVDELLYEKGFLDTSLPFPQLRARAQINAAAQQAGDTADFSRLIREAAGIQVP